MNKDILSAMLNAILPDEWDFVIKEEINLNDELVFTVTLHVGVDINGAVFHASRPFPLSNQNEINEFSLFITSLAQGPELS